MLRYISLCQWFSKCRTQIKQQQHHLETCQRCVLCPVSPSTNRIRILGGKGSTVSRAFQWTLNPASLRTSALKNLLDTRESIWPQILLFSLLSSMCGAFGHCVVLFKDAHASPTLPPLNWKLLQGPKRLFKESSWAGCLITPTQVRLLLPMHEALETWR